MEIARFETPSCCGGKSKGVAIILSEPLTIGMLTKVLATGQWAEAKYQTAAGMFYVENKHLIAHGPFNKTQLDFKCKFAMPPIAAKCDEYINQFITLISSG